MTNLEEVDPADEPRTYRRRPLPRKRLAVDRSPGVTVQLHHRVRADLRGHRRSRATSTTSRSTTRRRDRRRQRRRATPGCRPATRSSRSTASRSTTGTTLRSAIEQQRRRRRSTFIGRARRQQRTTSTLTPNDRQDGQGFLGVVARPPRSATSSVLGAVPESFNVDGHVVTGDRRRRSAISSRRRA